MKCSWDHLMHQLLGQQMVLMDARRFLDRVWRLFVEENGAIKSKNPRQMNR